MTRKNKILFSTPLAICATTFPLIASVSCSEKWDSTWDYIKDETTKHFVPHTPEGQRPTDEIELLFLVGSYMF